MPNSFSPEKFIEDDFVFPAESTAIIEVLEVQQSPLMVAVNLFLSMASLSYVKTSALDIGEMYRRVMLAVKTTVRSASHCWREQLLGFMMSFLQFSVRLVTITFGGLTVDTWMFLVEQL